MGMLSFLKKKTESISMIPMETREEIIIMKENGLLPNEIAQELDLDARQVSKVLYNERMRGAKRGSSSTEEDPIKQMQIEIKRLELEQKKREIEWAMEDREAARREELEEEQEELTDSITNSDDPMTLIVAMMAQKFLSKHSSENLTSQAAPGHPSGAAPSQQTQQVAQSLSDEQIEQVVLQNRAHVKKIQKLDDETLKGVLVQYFPQFTPDTYERAVQVIKKTKL